MLLTAESKQKGYFLIVKIQLFATDYLKHTWCKPLIIDIKK